MKRTQEDASSLIARIKAQQATPEEMHEGYRLVKAIDAAQEAGEAGEVPEEHLEILKAWGLVDDEDAEAEADDTEADPAAVAAGAATGEVAKTDPAELQKAVAALPDAADDVPEVGDLQKAINESGAPAKAAVDVSPVLQATVAQYDRIAKALETNAVATQAQNLLLGQVVPELTALRTEVDALKTAQGELRKALAPAEAKDEGSPLLKAISGDLANQLQERLGAVETLLNSRPRMNGNPARGAGLLKAMDRGAGVPYYKAIEIIQKSALADFDKSEALGTLQHAIDAGRPFEDVLNSYDLMGAAGN